MNVVWQYRKMMGLAFLLLAAFAMLAGQLVNLQVVRHEELLGLAANNTVRTIPREPMRGQILDIRGNPLATSLPAKLICADPSLLNCSNAPLLAANCRAVVAQALAPLLQTTPELLLDRLTPRLLVAGGKTNLSQYVALQHQVPLETWDKIKQTMATLPLGVDESRLNRQEQLFCRSLRAMAIFATDEQKRVYPGQSLAAHVVGYVSGEGRGTNRHERHRAGIQLRAQRHPRLAADRTGQAPARIADLPRRGRRAARRTNVVLTLDAGLQNIVEVRTGRGMQPARPDQHLLRHGPPAHRGDSGHGQLPNFDPNHPGRVSRWRPCATASSPTSHEPGSTFKIVVVSGALDERAGHAQAMFLTASTAISTTPARRCTITSLTAT